MHREATGTVGLLNPINLSNLLPFPFVTPYYTHLKIYRLEV